MALSTAPICPDRVRQIDGSFTFIPSRFLHGGFLATLNHTEAALYLFLLLASNRHGVSRYHYDRICTTTGMDGDTYLRARDGLIAKDLIAYDNGRFQVLALPPRPIVATCPPPSKTPELGGSVEGSHDDHSRSLQSIREILDSLAK